MIIDCVADLHGHYPQLDGGDLLIIAGDLTARDTHSEYLKFFSWLHKQDYKHYIFIAGNHDNLIQIDEVITSGLANTTYLCDSGTEFHGTDVEGKSCTMKIYGSPWTKTFEGMNPHCKAFTFDTEEELAEKWSLIPDDIDILITHSPPQDILDKNINNEKCGSKSLRRQMGRITPKIWIFGHIHESYGEYKDKTLSGVNYHFINASHVNEYYEPVNKPIRVIL